MYGADTVYPTDIGCYTLGLLPPMSMGDFVICMGSSVSTACGFSTATDQKVVAFIGDSTFFHSGITGLINAVHNNHKFTLVILDNGTTAMTGHQIHPGVDTTPMGLNLPQVIVEEVVRGCGVKDLQVVKPFNVKKTMESIKASMEYDGLSVVVSQEFCPLFAKGIGKARNGKTLSDQPGAVQEPSRLHQPAGMPGHVSGRQCGRDQQNLCIGCSVCAQVCPENAIVPRKD